MVRTLLVAAIALAMTACAAPAPKTPHGLPAGLGGIVTPAPEGTCTLSDRNPVDLQALILQRQLNAGSNHVLSMFADCGELQAARAGNGELFDIGTYLAPMIGSRPLAGPRAEILAALAGEFDRNGQAAMDSATGDVQRRADRAAMGVEIGEAESLGLLRHDDEALYTGLVQGISTDTGDTVVLATVIALTVIDGWIVSINTGDFYDGPGTVDTLLADQRRNVRRLLAANPAVY
ncbi:MAG: hypothetical protein HKM95_07335 [Inquilinus sp.]|nr:hypothetical protein [Inquilinus sp.]